MSLASDFGTAAGGAIVDWLLAQSSMAGQIITWPAAGNLPVGWLECDGRALSPADHPRLFAVIGTAYGGDGVDSFNLPDLRGRVPLGRSAFHAVGQQVGAESVSVTLDSANLPSHTHTATFTSGTASSTTASVAIPAYDGSTSASVAHTPSPSVTLTNAFSGTTAAKVYSTAAATTTLKPFSAPVSLPSISGTVAVSNSGSGQALNIPTLPPVLVMTYIICTGIGVTQPVGYSWHGVKTTYQSLPLPDLSAKLAADTEFSAAAAIMLASRQMPDRVNGEYAQWDFEQARQDAVNLPLAELLNQLNPSDANYSRRFADMHQMLVGSGVIVERRTVRRLAPLHDPDSSTTVYAWAAQADGLPAGSLSAPSVYGNDTGVSVSRALDNPAYGSYTFPGVGAGVGWHLQYALDSPAIWQRLELQLSASNWRPTQINISVGDLPSELVSIGDFTLSGTASGDYISATVTFNAPPAKIMKMTVIAVENPMADGYPIYNAVPYGVLL